MQSKPEMHLYEYAVIRYVPRVEREEFFNVGLIMMCKRKKWLKCRVHINRDKYALYDNALAIDTLQHQLDALGEIASGNSSAGSIATLPVEERFRWLSAVKSACIQTSRPHPGLAADLDSAFECIYTEQVL